MKADPAVVRVNVGELQTASRDCVHNPHEHTLPVFISDMEDHFNFPKVVW